MVNPIEQGMEERDEYVVRPIEHNQRSEILRGLAGRHPDDIHGIVHILFAASMAHEDPVVLKAMQKVHEDNGAKGIPNGIEKVESLLLDYINYPEHQDEFTAFGGDASNLPPVV
jgi:hypothetical protein